MAPPKTKLHMKTGKMKTIPPPTPITSNSAQISTESTNSERDLEANRQMEVELCWCIQQLECSMNSGKLSRTQAQDVEKHLKILKSSNQPIIKKRQLMRTAFGDYRAKMADEEKKMSLASKLIKFSSVNSNAKSHFFKKSGRDFKFNFPIEQIEQLNLEDNQTKDNNAKEAKQMATFNFIPSDNSFKFNFDVKDENS